MQRAQPNILLFFPDELRYDWGGTANNPFYSPNDPLQLRTPHLNALTARGVRFTRAFVATPVCAPSRACLASGREYDWAGQGSNGASIALDHSGDFAVEELGTFMQELQARGYWTMVTGRDDLTKKTGPGLDGAYHTALLGFNDSARCAGSVDVTWGECAGTDHGAAPCAGRFQNESQRHATVHEPYGAYLQEQRIDDASVRAQYNASDYFALDFARYAELQRRGPYDSVHWYAIPDTLPFSQQHYQDDWIGRQAVALLARAPRGVPWFLEVSHQAPHPPMDITPDMEASMAGRESGWPLPYACDGAAPPSAPWEDFLCSQRAVQRLRHNYAAKVERLDALLGTYLDAIDRRGAGELANTVFCLASDHGDMLADRGATAKEKPWMSAMSVPLVLAGPGIAAGAVVDAPVSTMDLAATFIELAGGAVPKAMNSTSLLPLLRDPTAPPPRTVVHSGVPPRRSNLDQRVMPPRGRVRGAGLANFRVVIANLNSTHHLKLICCTNFDARGRPKGCPGATQQDKAEMARRQAPIEVHLYNIAGAAYERVEAAAATAAPVTVALRFEPPSADLAADRAHDGTLRRLAALLPPDYHRPSYSWPGCNISAWIDAGLFSED